MLMLVQKTNLFEQPKGRIFGRGRSLPLGCNNNHPFACRAFFYQLS